MNSKKDEIKTCGNCAYFKSDTCHANPPTVIETGEYRYDRRPEVKHHNIACRFFAVKGGK